MRFGFVLGGLMLATPAMAADLPYEAPPAISPVYSPTPAYNWGGLYLGIQGGYDWNHASTPPDYTANENGGILGVYAGYNWQTASNWVLGVDASFNLDGARGSGSSPTLPSPTSNTAGPLLKGLVRGRVGYAWDRFMIYGTAGGAWMHYTALTVGPLSARSATPVGWTVGLGAEMAITQHLVGRLDYAYQNYGSFTLPAAALVPSTPVAVNSSTLTVGLAYKF